MKIVITGGAGLVGQNLVERLAGDAGRQVVVIDKNAHNLTILAERHPEIVTCCADLAHDDGWQHLFEGCDVLVNAHAQIGGNDVAPFTDNNVLATERVLAAAVPHRPYVVNISSSVVNSLAVDYYTETKKAQEAIVKASGLEQIVLRPTLMFGWFDRKHVGWLARFMRRSPVFPIPGSGRYLRQPLYVGDFCAIIRAAIDRRITGEYNISGQQRIDYVDLMKTVRDAARARARIVHIPTRLFAGLLYAYGIFSENPPFTPKQLKALSTPDVFEVIDWPTIFGVRATPLREALDETFRDPRFADVVLTF